MNNKKPIDALFLKLGHKAYKHFLSQKIEGRDWRRYSVKAHANDLIRQLIDAPEPCMISRLGSTELNCVRNHLGVRSDAPRSRLAYIQGQRDPWWWEEYNAQKMSQWSGFFPPTREKLAQFSELMLSDIRLVDCLGSWLTNEDCVAKELAQCKQVVLEDVEPFFAERPWTHALAGKKVLVVHPFVQTIEAQYAKRSLIFPDGLLPEFELKTVPAVQSLGGESSEFTDWFEALDSMKAKIDAQDYDVALIGAGAYGLPLAAHVKRSGKKAIHLGGATQLLFGILGRRWEENYIVWPYRNLFNKHWVRPMPSETPQAAKNVENACYW